MSTRFKNLDWDALRSAPASAIRDGYEGVDVSGSLVPSGSVVQRSGEVQASVSAIEVTDKAINVVFKLASDEDVEAWGGVGENPFAWLKVGGVAVNDGVMTQKPLPGNWALVYRSEDPFACAALRDVAKLSSPVSISGALRTGRFIFGFWNPDPDGFRA